MKSLLIFLLSMIILQTSFSQSEWIWISPSPPYQGVYSSTVIDNKAFIWGEYNSVLKLDFETEKFTMLPTYAPYENCGGDFAQGIAFADSMIGYITDDCHGEFRTTDGGLTWTKTANSGSNISLVVFGSSQIGWKLGIGGFYRTYNAGESWIFAYEPFFEGGGFFSRMYALNQNQLWILKKTYYNGIGADVWYSSNSGNSWSRLNTGLISDSLNQVSYIDMKMGTTGIGFIIGSIYKPANNSIEGFILKTTDMGLTWTAAKYPEERFLNILYISDNEWVVLGNQGNYISNNSAVIQRKTTDAGDSWTFSKPLDLLVNNSYLSNSITAPITGVIYTFAISGIYKSLDRGISYEKVTSETDVLVSKIAFDSKPNSNDSQLGLAWLQWNTKPFLLSTDAGITWHQKSLPQSMGSIWLVGIAEEVIYMIVNQLKLYKSTDLGGTWQQLYLPVYSGLQALSVYSKDVLVLNAYEKLVSTTDGGNSWILGPTLGNVWLQETDIMKPGFIEGVGTYHDSLGEKGCFFRTSDYGLSWHLFDTDNKIKDVNFITEQLGYALGDKKLYKTTDGGITWNIIWEQGFLSFAFSDSVNGMVDSDEGLKQTTDGGKSWVKKDYKIPFAGANKMLYNARGDLFLISGVKMVMIPSNQNPLPEIHSSNYQPIAEYHLSSSFPNPFNSSSTIKYFIPTTSHVSIKIFNTLGEEIKTLVDEEKSNGAYEVTWNAHDLTSGVYFYRMQSGSFVQTNKMILLK